MNNETIIALADKITGGCSLGSLFDGKPRAYEAELIVAQTIRATQENLTDHGEAFALLSPSLDSCTGGGLCDNRTAYDWLKSDGFLREDKRNGKAVIFPTKKLILLLQSYFKDAP